MTSPAVLSDPALMAEGREGRTAIELGDTVKVEELRAKLAERAAEEA